MPIDGWRDWVFGVLLKPVQESDDRFWRFPLCSALILPHISTKPRCHPNLLLKFSSRKPIKRQTLPLGGSHLHQPSTRKRAICTNRRQTPSNSRSCLRMLAMPLQGKQSAARNATRSMKLQMHGGTQLRPTNKASPIVRAAIDERFITDPASASGDPSLDSDDCPPHTKWKVPSSCRQGEGNCADLSPRIQRSSQGL